MNTYIIYKLTFPNNKVRIGQTISKFKTRMNRYKSNAYNKSEKNNEYNSYISNAIRKYGWDSVKKEILFSNVSKEFINELETKTIAEYKSANKEFGYNILEIGESRKGFKHSKKSKKLISENNAKFWFGKLIPKESKERMRQAHLGFKHSEETKKIWSEQRKGINNSFYGKTHSKESIEKNRQSHLGKSNLKTRKPIDVYTKTGEYVKTFESIKQSGIELNVCVSNIVSVLTNNRKSTGGYTFKYNYNIGV